MNPTEQQHAQVVLHVLADAPLTGRLALQLAAAIQWLHEISQRPPVAQEPTP